jgi:aminotransferase
MIKGSVFPVNAVDWLRSIPEQNRSRVFLIDAASGKAVTFWDLHQEALKIAANLRALEFKRGERIAVVASNSVALAKFFFGCLYAGVCVVPLNPVLSDEEIAFVVGHAKARCLAFSADLAGRFSADSTAVRGKARMLLDEDGSRAAEMGALSPWKTTAQVPSLAPLEGVEPQDPLVIVYTSGTTAKPKGVVHRVASLVDNARLFGQWVGAGPNNRFYNMLPMTYLGGYYNLLLLPYVCQSSVVLTEAFNAAALLNFWGNVIAHEVNTLWVVPSIISMLLRLDRSTQGERYCREKVRLTLCGTAPLLPTTRHAFEERYGLTVHENYGLSETTFITSNAPSFPVVDGSVGRPLPHIEVRLVDDKRRQVANGADGEILVRTPFLMDGYFDTDTGRVEDPTEDGWLATGDLGRFLPDGGLAITGRKKDLIIRGGINISPSSIEEVIGRHPAIVEVAVVGIPDPVLGENIVAVLKLDEGAAFPQVKEEVLSLCSQALAKIKQPSHIMELSDFPKTATGKLQKNKIRAWVASKIGGDAPALAKSTPPGPSGGARPATALQPSKVVSDIVEAMSIKYNTMVYEMQARGIDVTVLSLGEAFFDIPLFPFDDLPFPKLYHYSHSRGITELRERLAEYFLDNYDVAFDPAKEILVTAGSKIAIYMALLAVVNPGDEVITHDPAWVSYSEQIRLCHGVPVSVPYHCDVTDFDRFITNRTKMIIINSPNNPRGKTYNLEELTYLNRLAQKHNLYVLSDEAYSDFLLDEQRFVSLGNIDREKTHTIVVNSISKNFGISGWRLGYLITNEALISQMLKINQHLVTCPPTILAYYIAKHFSEIIRITKPQIKDVVRKRQALAGYMDKIGLTALEGDSTFYFFVGLGDTKLTSEQFCDRLLLEHHICAVPGIGYGQSCDRFIRVSIGAESMERIQAGLDRIKALIVETS